VVVARAQINTWLHELGHNIGLEHSNGNSASGYIAEYTDTSCAMGFGETMAVFVCVCVCVCVWRVVHACVGWGLLESYYSSLTAAGALAQ
jgi:hypothetical protein